MEHVVIFIILLLLVGTGAICTEFFMPGFGFFGIIGIILLLASAILTVVALPFGIFLLLLEMTCITIFFLLFFRYVKRRQLYGKIILDETLRYESKEIANLDYFLGKEGHAVIPLKPFGSVDFNGHLMDVWSDSGYIENGKKVKVVKVEGDKIWVRELKEEEQQ